MADTTMSACFTYATESIGTLLPFDMTHELRQVLGATMALGDRGIATPEHGGHWASNDITAAEYYSMATSDLDTRVIQEFNYTSRCAGSEKRLRSARRQVTDIVCVESVQLKLTQCA